MRNATVVLPSPGIAAEAHVQRRRFMGETDCTLARAFDQKQGRGFLDPLLDRCQGR